LSTVNFPANAAAPSAIYTLSLHDALPILRSERRLRRKGPDPHRSWSRQQVQLPDPRQRVRAVLHAKRLIGALEIPLHRLFRDVRSEEHTSELQSREKLVCRPLLVKKTVTR